MSGGVPETCFARLKENYTQTTKFNAQKSSFDVKRKFDYPLLSTPCLSVSNLILCRCFILFLIFFKSLFINLKSDTLKVFHA